MKAVRTLTSKRERVRFGEPFFIVFRKILISMKKIEEEEEVVIYMKNQSFNFRSLASSCPPPPPNKKTKSPSLLRKLTPLVVAFTHRRILDYAGGIQSSAYSNVIANAERCGGLVQLGPLDSEEREDYLRQTLKVSSLPVEVYKWVSDVANGNPQYIEICAKEVCF
jgi:hypothetical protein